MTEGGRLLRLALSIDKDDPDALCIAGRVTAYMFGDVEKAKEMVDRAVALNPNSSLAWEQRGWACEYSGQDEEASEASSAPFGSARSIRCFSRHTLESVLP